MLFRSQDASKTYDGTELTGSDEVTAEGLPAGFRAKIEVEGSLTDAGTASNHITGYVIYNAAGRDSSAYFTGVQTVDGVLRIDPRKVTISSASAEKVYDGKELTTADLEEAGITVSGDGFAEGEGAEYTVTGTQTLTGMSPNAFTYTLMEGTSAANYEITQSFGTLTVKNRAADEKYQITAEAAGGSFTYDGTAHTIQGLVTDTFTVDGQTYTLEGLTSTRTERGAGTYEIALSGTPVVRDADGNDVTEEFWDDFAEILGIEHVRINKDKDSKSLWKHLTLDEFRQIEKADLPTESLRGVRDLFVFQTYTCLSYIDLTSFDWSKVRDMNGKKLYVGTRGKTKQEFSFLLLRPALAILKRYKGKLPIISNVKYNSYLKAVAQFAGIEKPITSHWARHTGATILLNMGVDMEVVAKILGHSSTKMTRQVYAKLLDETVVKAMAGAERRMQKKRQNLNI